MNLLLHLIAPFVGLATFVAQKKDQVNFFLMGFFRDVGRIKAKNRRVQNGSAMIASSPGSEASNWDIMFKRDDPLGWVDLDVAEDDLSSENGTEAILSTSSLTTFTLSELNEFGDGTNGKPILLSLFGRVYDVSAGSKYYGEGGKYSGFAGQDVTYALSTGCKTPECVNVRRSNQEGGEGSKQGSKHSLEDLTEKQLKEGKRWLSFFYLHDKYRLIGRLDADPDSWLDALVDTALVDSHNNEEEKQEQGEEDQSRREGMNEGKQVPGIKEEEQTAIAADA